MQRRTETSQSPGTSPGPGLRRERPARGHRPTSRRKVYQFFHHRVRVIEYKEASRNMKRYKSDRAKIEPRRKTGTCAKHQRRLSVAIKQARHMALLPYTAEHMRGM